MAKSPLPLDYGIRERWFPKVGKLFGMISLCSLILSITMVVLLVLEYVNIFDYPLILLPIGCSGAGAVFGFMGCIGRRRRMLALVCLVLNATVCVLAVGLLWLVIAILNDPNVH
ncbi:MAG: hypothetical protein ABSB33_14670 [Tepidisphaeraceae bacterium]|jgi:hypothetical protein